jgi:hypothetical protein
MSNFLHGVATFLIHLVVFVVGFGAGVLCSILIIG